MGKFRKGNVPWNKGLTKDMDSRISTAPRKPSMAARKKLSETRKMLFRKCLIIHPFLGKKGKDSPNYGHKHSQETIGKMRISKLGDKNPMKRKYAVTKRLETIKKKYPNWGDFNKGKKNGLWKAGKNHPCYGKPMSKERRELQKQIRAKQKFPSKDTSIEIKIQNFLKELKIEFVTHKYIKEVEHSYQCDIFVPSMNLIIECDGDYWHGNKDLYPDNKLSKRIITQRATDKVRNYELVNGGFNVLRMWEHKIRDMQLEDFKNKLLISQLLPLLHYQILSPCVLPSYSDICVNGMTFQT